jgi:hypothetical protein
LSHDLKVGPLCWDCNDEQPDNPDLIDPIKNDAA